MKRRVVRIGSEDSIRFRFLIDFDEPTIIGTPTAAIHEPGGGLVSAATATVSVTNSLITVTGDWTESLFSELDGYQLRLVIDVGGVNHRRTVYFAIVPRGFDSEVCDQDVIDEIPSLTQQVANLTDGLKPWRRAGWEEIESEVASQLADIRLWQVLDPSVFKRAHIYATAWRFYSENYRYSGPESEEYQKKKDHEAEYRRALRVAMTLLPTDLDDDDLLSEDEGEAKHIAPVQWLT